ncbi:MAG: DUF4126 domain-containing protein [Planctomycetes bacterium]|nr:DUF4126 domain-containing protein [Planctomycetota bacterium]
MDMHHTLALIVGPAWASGLNVYATIASLGLAGRLGAVELPEKMAVLEHPAVIAIAAVLYAIEFFADKIPWLDSTWDAVHTFIRPPAGALLAYAAASDASPTFQMCALLLGGTLAAGSHAVKSATRVGLNASPEPFTNIAASVAEDITSFFTVALTIWLPWLAIGLVIVATLVTIVLLPRMIRLAYRTGGKVVSWFRPKRKEAA